MDFVVLKTIMPSVFDQGKHDEYEDLSVLESILEGSKKPEYISLQVLKHITDYFSEGQIVGRGGCGVVYKGTLPNGQLVAVKKISSQYTIDDKQFDQEFQSMIRVEHKNIVKFLGYCSNTVQKAMELNGSFILADERERLLCFEYINNGSLEGHLSDELRGHEWHTRFQIIKGICDGLHHLHDEKRIIHMDLKPANILLDDNMVPKITDFGISRLDGTSQTMSTQRLCTPGYCAPEYRFHGKISPKSDIYSLGVIITELVTGSRETPNIKNICRRWRHRWRKSGKYRPLEYQQVIKCLQLALRCMHRQLIDRPDIGEIISELNEMGTDRHISDVNGSTVDQNISFLDDMLGIEPLELHLPVLLHKQIRRSIKLTNYTDDYIAFRITKTGPLPYRIKPYKDVVPPHSVCTVAVTLEEEYEYRAGEFYVQSTRVDKGLTAVNVTNELFSEEADKLVDTVNLTTSLRDSTELLQVYPREFRYPLQLNRVLSFSLQLTNRSEDYMAFRFQFSNKVMKYSSAQSKGILPPWSTWVVILRMEAREEALLDKQDKDIVILQTLIINNDLKPDNITVALFKENTDVQDVCLDVVLVAAPQPQPCIQVPRPDDHARDATMLINPVSIDVEFLEIYPSVLQFKFEANKPIRCSISLVNKSEHAFCFILMPDNKVYFDIDVDQDYVWPHSTCCVHMTMKREQFPPPEIGNIRILMVMCRRSELILKSMSYLASKDHEGIKRIIGGGWAREVSLGVVVCYPGSAVEATVIGDDPASDIEAIGKKEAIYTDKDIGRVLCMDVHPTEPWIVTAHSKYICLWKDQQTNACSRMFLGEYWNTFACVKFIARKHWIASGDNRGFVHVYTYIDGLERVLKFRAHNGCVKSLAIHSSRPYLLSCSDRISLWNWDRDLKISQVFFTIDCVRQMDFNPKDTMTFFNGSYEEKQIDDFGTGDILIWSNENKWQQVCIHAGPADVACYVQGSEWRYLAIGDNKCTQLMHKCTTRVKIWDLQSNRCVHKLECLVDDETRMDELFSGEEAQIVAVACHPGRPLLVTGTNRGDVYVWNSTTYRLETSICFRDGSIHSFGFIDTDRLKRLVIGFDDRIEMVEIDWSALTGQSEVSVY